MTLFGTNRLTSSTGTKFDQKKATLIEQLKLSVKKSGNQLWLKVALIDCIEHFKMMEIFDVNKKHSTL